MDVDTEVSKEGGDELTTGELAYPTPEQTPPAALLAATIENEGDRRLEDSTFEVWKARTLVLAQGLKALHRRDLPWNGSV